MCVKFLPENLNLGGLCPPHPTNTYTCRVTIASRVRGGNYSFQRCNKNTKSPKSRILYNSLCSTNNILLWIYFIFLVKQLKFNMKKKIYIYIYIKYMTYCDWWSTKSDTDHLYLPNNNLASECHVIQFIFCQRWSHQPRT